jgi:thymidylate synthase
MPDPTGDCEVIRTSEHEKLALHYILLTRQMSSLSDCLLHLIRLDRRASGSTLVRRRKGYVDHASTELADIIMQVKRLCVILGLEYWNVDALAERRDSEKSRDFRRRYPSEPWI